MPYGEKLIHLGGWNTDDDLLMFPPTDWTASSYLRPYDGGSTNVGQPNLSSARGNTLYVNSGLAAGTNIIVGIADYPEANSFLVAYYNSGGSHSIWRYYYDNNTTPDLVIQNSVLNFQIGKRLFNFKVVNHVAKWTDGYFDSFLSTGGILGFNPPRELDVKKALDGDYSSFPFQLLDVIKWPPTEGPQVSYQTDPAVGSNKLYGFLYQFRYQYVYDTGAVSAWSPISVLPLPTQSEFITGRNYLDPNADNFIRVTIQTAPEFVTKIRVAARRGNGEIFYIFEELDKEQDGIGNNTTFNVDFYGDASLKPLPALLPNFDYVPQVAGHQEVLPLRENGVAMSYADYYENYDNDIVPDVVLGYQISEKENCVNRQNNFQFSEVSSGTSTTIEFNANDPNICYAMEGDVYSFSFNDGGVQVTVVYTVTAGDITAINSLGTETLKLAYLITAVGSYCATELGTTGSYGLLTYTLVGGFTGLADGVLLYAYTNRPTNPLLSLKTGFNWPVGIQYYDRALRSGTVVDLGTVYVDFPSEQDTSTFNDPNSPYTTALRLSIDHVPPAWARYWQPVVQIPYTDFMQRSVSRIQADGANRIKVSLESFYLTSYGVVTNNGLQGGATYNYTPDRGDVMRFIRQQIDTGDPALPAYCTEYVEVQVLAYSPSEGEGGSECVWVNYFDAPSLLGGLQAYGGFVIEIYRPRPSTDSVQWNEVGEVFDVLNPYTNTRAHEGNVQNQVNGGVPAIIDMAYGDVYLRPRNMGTKFDDAVSQYACWWIEDKALSDYYESDANSIGRVAIEDPNNKRKKYIADIRHSKSAIENSGINGLNTFTFEDKASLSESDGEISRIMVVGQTLKVLQPQQETSVYLQQAYSVDPDGGGQTAFSSKVFGGVRRMEGQYGCDISGLVTQFEGVFYYFDRRFACLVASTQGGQRNLCEGEYKFNQGGVNIRTAIDPFIFGDGNIEECIMSVNPLHKEIQLWIGGVDTGTFYSNCYVFNLVRNRWTTSMTHNIRYCLNIGQVFYSTTGEDLYFDSPSADFMSFNGVDAETLAVNLSVVDSTNYSVVKVPLNVFWMANVLPTTFEVYAHTPNPNATTPFGQVLVGAWQSKENSFVAPISKDMTDPAYTGTSLAPVASRNLRGNTFLVSTSVAGEQGVQYRYYGLSLNTIVSPPLP